MVFIVVYCSTFAYHSDAAGEFLHVSSGNKRKEHYTLFQMFHMRNWVAWRCARMV